jgi:hypothetical protein
MMPRSLLSEYLLLHDAIVARIFQAAEAVEEQDAWRGAGDAELARDEAAHRLRIGMRSDMGVILGKSKQSLATQAAAVSILPSLHAGLSKFVIDCSDFWDSTPRLGRPEGTASEHCGQAACCIHSQQHDGDLMR